MTMQVLEFYGLEKQNKWAQLGYESLFFAGFTFLAWAVSALTSIAFLHFTHLLHAQDFQRLLYLLLLLHCWGSQRSI